MGELECGRYTQRYVPTPPQPSPEKGEGVVSVDFRLRAATVLTTGFAGLTNVYNVSLRRLTNRETACSYLTAYR